MNDVAVIATGARLVGPHSEPGAENTPGDVESTQAAKLEKEMSDMNKLNRIIGIAPLTILGSVFIAGCGAEAQDEPNVLPEPPSVTPKAPCCSCPGPPSPLCGRGPICGPGTTNPTCTPTNSVTQVYVDTQGDLRIQGTTASDTIGVKEPVTFTLEIDDPNRNLDPGSGCWHPNTANQRIVRCGVPWHSRIFANLGASADLFWTDLGRQAVVNGGSGNDTIVSGGADDLLVGGTGDDHLYGRDGNDVLWGAEDNDSLFGGAHDDSLDGNDGTDTANGEGGSDVCTAETRTNCEF